MNDRKLALERREALGRFRSETQEATFRKLLHNANDTLRAEQAHPGRVLGLLRGGLSWLFEAALVHEAQRAIRYAVQHVNRRFPAEFETAERLSFALWSTGNHKSVLKQQPGGEP